MSDTPEPPDGGSEPAGDADAWDETFDRLDAALRRLEAAADGAAHGGATPPAASPDEPAEPAESAPPARPARSAEPAPPAESAPRAEADAPAGWEPPADDAPTPLTVPHAEALAAATLVAPSAEEGRDFWSRVRRRFEGPAGGEPGPDEPATRPRSAAAPAGWEPPADGGPVFAGRAESTILPPVAGREPRGAGRLVYALLAVALVLGAVGAAYLVLVEPGNGPLDWTAETRPLAEAVERARGVEFARPVRVETVSERTLATRAAADPLHRTFDRSVFARRGVEFLRSLGLWEGELDPVPRRQPGTVHDWAFYDAGANRLFVKAGERDAAWRTAVVHELAVALDDQRHRLVPRSGDEGIGYAGLVAGDADLVTREYVATLPAEEQTPYALMRAPLGPTVAGVPAVIVMDRYAGDRLGTGLAAALAFAPGGDRRDAAFQRPPDRSENLLAPATYLDAEKIVSVAAPPPPAGARVVARGRLGAVGWLAMLGERVDPKLALRAVDGWGGDAYVSYQREGRTCTTLAWRGDRPEDLVDMADALTRWSQSMPAAVSAVRGDTLFVASCDPGPSTPLLRGGATTTFAVAAARSTLFANHTKILGPQLATCVSELMIRAAPVDQIVDGSIVKGTAFDFFQPPAVQRCQEDPGALDEPTPTSVPDNGFAVPTTTPG